MNMFLVISYVILAIIALALSFVAFKLIQLYFGKQKLFKQQSTVNIKKFKSIGTVQQLKIIPLVDYYTDQDNLQTEAGVSYLLQADKKTILFDTGYNKYKRHPSPLLHNMQELGYSLDDLDLIFISHLHCDHVGGDREEKEGLFSISQGPLALPEIPVFTPVAVNPSSWNPGPEVRVIEEPYLIDKGIVSTGVIPRYLFLLGLTLEQSLAINVAGKGIVLVIGCGHQGMENIIERTKLLFDEPIYGIVGGLHYPVKGGRMNIGPFNMQQIVATDDPPWCGMNEEKVNKAMTAIKNTGAKKISLSAHDSSDWCLELFRKTFNEAYVPLKAGAEIIM
jgi:7,8-dihydropterin-6-yl-methyl-4-(beta-D-ribofuranosyl)aminobenzene 5'-phosphate synthase